MERGGHRGPMDKDDEDSEGEPDGDMPHGDAGCSQDPPKRGEMGEERPMRGEEGPKGELEERFDGPRMYRDGPGMHMNQDMGTYGGYGGFGEYGDFDMDTMERPMQGRSGPPEHMRKQHREQRMEERREARSDIRKPEYLEE